MDIIRITLEGYGCEITRGTITEGEHNKIKNSNSLDNTWFEGLHKHLGKQWKEIDEELHDYGIMDGDVLITVNDDTIIDLPISVLNTFDDLVDMEGYYYPHTDEIIVTSTQYQVGVITDIMFMTEDDFDMSKLKFVEKDIHNKDDEVIIKSLICEIYYDEEPIPFLGSQTDLELSNVHFDTTTHEKN